MPPVLWILLITCHLVGAASDESPMLPMPAPAPRPDDCPSKCGDVEIPYPFGIGKDCAWPGLDHFILTCDNSSTTPRPYAGNAEIKNISLEAGEMIIVSTVSSFCPETSSGEEEWSMNATGSSYLISPSRNEFTAIGCYTQLYMIGSKYATGCFSYCMSLDAAAHDGDECTGLGCCQGRIPPGLSAIRIQWSKIGSWPFSPCSYAFIGEKGWYKFKRQDLGSDGNNSFLSRAGTDPIPLVLDWAIRQDGSCRPPSNNSGPSAKPTASACVSDNSYCVDDPLGKGYLCKCSDGYKGNPYLTGAKGCTNIDECEIRKSKPGLYPCGSHSECRDTNGGYDCICKHFYRGDGKSAKGCVPIVPAYAITIVATFVAFILACFITLAMKKRKQKHFFDKNGGEILRSMGINIFTEQQLKRITDGYSVPIGEGAFGKVFRGTIDENQRVAVKRASVKAEALPQEEFVNEITFQFRISHVNLVRLVGCCLETNVPMLVFEFVPNGSLYNVLHGASRVPELSLPTRLDIAIGSAEALAHMHSHGGHNHVHGDIKSGNILIGDDFTPKVSDFGSSKLVSITSKYAKWCVSGDLSYIDPVYIKSGRFTVKSDVYSFGVVLLELITRKTAKYGDNNSLPIDFIKSCKEEGDGRQMYDAGLFNHDDQYHCYMECLHRIGALAVRCLKEDEDERPTMADVVEELKQVKLTVCGGPCSEAS